MTMPNARPAAHAHAPELDDAFDLELEQMALAVGEPPLEEPREPALSRYLKFQIRDFVRHRGLPMLAIALVGIWIFHYNFDTMLAERAQRRPDAAGPDDVATLFHAIVSVAMLLFAGVGSLISAAGIVSRDREGGHQRFLFAKPVRITRFYLQAFAVNGIGLLATAALVLGATSLAFLRPVPVLEPLLAVGGMYAAVGGLAFLLSTLVRFDAAATLLLALLAFPLRGMAERGHWWAIATSWLLPPLDTLQAFDPSPRHADASVLASVRSLVLYGAAYVVAGVAVLKKRSVIR